LQIQIQQRRQIAAVNEDFGHLPSKDGESVSMCQNAKKFIMLLVAGDMDE
jgi:hypothetical protein